MKKEAGDTIRHISDTLDKILEVLSKPPNKAVKIFELISMGIGIVGILSVIDILKNWLGG